MVFSYRNVLLLSDILVTMHLVYFRSYHRDLTNIVYVYSPYSKGMRGPESILGEMG